ncbi:acetyl-CoA C-acyltransferase [Metabacillus malikii]|uniref:Acetyl-CoA C-acetyltransferase n=1 Tax=Metabacillus malikii TaxID=1504265 RepID=A0ABT9ZEL3_9BACI|nr:acetyl-CoA C-acyltransferase [Metabacillus malikii]MDQ0230710.1 acetyl-CoA C-acetyltransferase [Metabacillus malikii]
MTRAVVVDAKRTIIGKKDGILKQYSPEVLASYVLKELSCNLEKQLDDVIVGNVVGPGGNIARLSVLESGLPYTIPGVTVDRQCGAGLESIRLACHLIQGGAGEIYIAGGVESTSQSPFKERARFSPAFIGDPDMGVAAEYVAEAYQISRQMQDEYAALSYKRAIQAINKNSYLDELVKIPNIPLSDEAVNPHVNYKRMLSRLKPCFKENGTVTIGNCCGVNDGAAAVLVMSEDKAKQLGLKPILRFVDSAVTGVHPHYPATGPIPSIRELLNQHSLTMQDIDLFEINEAFAVKIIACAKELEIPYEKINVSGGAIALGHPYGASGAILVTRLFYEVQRRHVKYAISTLGIGGGLGIAVLWESLV